MAKIVLIGPIKPFRGGIAHSNTILCKNLAKGNDLLVLSFKRLFPKALYPGKFQKEKGETPKEFESEFLIDSINPLSWWKAVKKIRDFRAEVVVFQWWTTFLMPCYWFIANRVKKARISIVCQNVLPHEKSKIHTLLSKTFFNQVDNFVTLAKSDERLLKKLVPNARVNTIIEPTYEELVGLKKIGKKKARKKLGMKKKKVLLFFGFVREYKGLEYLLKAMPFVLKKHDCLALVVGEFWEPKEKYTELIEKLGIREKVRIVDEYMPDEDVAYYFNASNVVVLPYVSSTESGIIQLAFGYNTPVITTRVGGNPDLIEDGKSGLLVEPCDERALGNAINLFFEKKLEKKFKKEMEKKKEIFKWNKEKEKAVLGL